MSKLVRDRTRKPLLISFRAEGGARLASNNINQCLDLAEISQLSRLCENQAAAGVVNSILHPSTVQLNDVQIPGPQVKIISDQPKGFPYT